MQHRSEQGLTRIQRKNRHLIAEAALEVFSREGLRGATLDEIAATAGLSKPNLLYYFDSKEAIYLTLIDDLMDAWLAPLEALDPEGEPMQELLSYVRRKLEMAREYPRESRLFANEILRGAPHIQPLLSDRLKPLVDAKAAVLKAWMQQGRLKSVHPHHLIFSIWAFTQHYADFEVQVRLLLSDEEPFAAAEAFVERLYQGLAV